MRGEERVSRRSARGDLSVEPLLGLREALEVAHHLPGRLRLRVARQAAARISPEIVGRLKSGLDRHSAIRSVRINVLAGSVVIEYDPVAIPGRLWLDLVEGTPEAAADALAALTATT